jgi:hypothetical protein
MTREIHECDKLRLPGQICEPDSRTCNFVKIDRRTGRANQRVVADQYEAIACFSLNDTVPEGIAIHFETAKNLYLYAWFVFRFYPVSEQQALASLEFALRERFSDFVKAQSGTRGLGLKKLLTHAIEKGYIRNELFTTRERWAWKRAETRYLIEKTQEMRLAGSGSIDWNEAEVVVTQDDLDCDWLKIFQETIPKNRNEYAHGSKALKHTVLHTFEMVTELINQLYPKKV